MMQIVFLVHGTWGKGERAWYQTTCSSTDFAERLKAALGKKGFPTSDLDIVPFEWSGGNTHSERLEGATLLASKLIALRKQYSDATFHFVAHSHGGNVVLKALEIYLNNLAWDDVPGLIDTRDVVATSERLLKDYAEGKYRFRPSTEEIEILLRKLSDTLGRLAQRGKKRFRFNGADGTIWDIERSSLRRLLGKIYSNVYTLPEHHRIGNVITLGTPFYEKRWRLSRAKKVFNWLMHCLFFVPIVSLIAYFYIVLGSVLAAATPWISWIGFNPLNWHWLLWAISGGICLVFVIAAAIQDKPELPRDTNVYFDEAVVPYYLKVVEPIKLCRVLNIHSSYLDEAYLLLSSYPLLSGVITKLYGHRTTPRFWDFKRTTEEVGFWRRSPPAVIQRHFRRLIRLASALTKAVAYPVRLVAHKFSAWYVARLLSSDLRVIGYGLPKDEFNQSSEIHVENALRKSYFDTHSLDVSDELAVLHVNGGDSENRFGFLWDDDDLANRIHDSILVRAFGSSTSSDESRKLMAVEERAREFFGVVGLRHSMYYDNDVVIDAIADFFAVNPPMSSPNVGAVSR